jgi:recombination protein RecA
MAKKTAPTKAGRLTNRENYKGENGRPDVDAMLDSHPALKMTVAQIEKQFGEGAIMPLGANHVCQITGIPTGSLSLDLALGGQGIPHGRVVEIFGPESSGKTTLALHVVAQAQRNGGIAAFIDAEHASTPAGPRSWASNWKLCW